MATQKSCGFLIMRGEPPREFLLMRHADRWDLPKGHVDPGETEMHLDLVRSAYAGRFDITRFAPTDLNGGTQPPLPLPGLVFWLETPGGPSPAL